MKKQVCFLIDRYVGPIAGTPSQIDKLMRGLQARDWQVDLAVLRRSDYVESGVCPVPVKLLGISSVLNPAGYWKLFKLAQSIKKGGTDVVHIFYNDASLMAPPVMKLAGLKVIISRRDMGYWYTTTLRRLLSITGHFVDAVQCNCEAIKSLTARKENIPLEKIHVIYNGYDTDEANVGGDVTIADDRRPAIGLVANIRPIKRIEDAIRAIGLLAKQKIEAHLHIIGGGKADACRALASACGVAKSVHFYGNCENTPAIVEQFDIGLLCSESEGLSNAIVEYMLAGLPVVCTDTGGNPELVDDGSNGYLVPVARPEILAERLKTLIDNSSTAKAMGRVGRGKVVAMVALDRMIAAHEGLYEQLVEVE